MPHCFIMPRTQKTRAHPSSELPSSRLASLACYAVTSRFATVLGASRLRLLRPHRRHYMSAYAASLRSVAPGSIFFFTLPGVPRLRRSTAGLLYGAPPGLRIRLACARQLSNNHPSNFRFIGEKARAASGERRPDAALGGAGRAQAGVEKTSLRGRRPRG